jgi:hypothetical protein
MPGRLGAQAGTEVEDAMDAPTDDDLARSPQDRSAELRREADAFRLTRTLAEQHAALFPRVRRLGAGLTGLAVASSRPVATHPAARPADRGPPPVVGSRFLPLLSA